MYGTGQFCHGYARGPWTAVAWWALYWNGPIRQTFLMVSGQIPTWNNAAKKYLGRENLSANIGKLLSESSCQTWPKYFAPIFLIRAAAGSVFLSRAKTFNINSVVIVVFSSEFFCQNVCRPWPAVFFAPKHLSFAGCVLLVSRENFRVPRQAFWCFFLSKRVNCFFICTKYFTLSFVSLPLIRNTISKNVHGNRGAILTTHSMEEADALCSRVGIMVKGQLKWVTILMIITFESRCSTAHSPQ